MKSYLNGSGSTTGCVNGVGSPPASSAKSANTSSNVEPNIPYIMEIA